MQQKVNNWMNPVLVFINIAVIQPQLAYTAAVARFLQHEWTFLLRVATSGLWGIVLGFGNCTGI